jgi:hypothetical protein
MRLFILSTSNIIQPFRPFGILTVVALIFLREETPQASTFHQLHIAYHADYQKEEVRLSVYFCFLKGKTSSVLRDPWTGWN